MKNMTRMTCQRMRILEYLQQHKTHPGAEQVHNALKKELPGLSLATVYRNLNLLAEEGKILKLEMKSKSCFDADMCSHHHGICAKCGRVVDIFNDKLRAIVLKEVKSREFSPSCVMIMFKGLCKNCKK